MPSCGNTNNGIAILSLFALISYLTAQMKRIIFKTGRLQIREFTPDDASFIIRLVNTSGWLQFIGEKNVHNVEDALAYLNNGPFESYSRFGFGMWHVSRLADQAEVGMCGLLQREGLTHPDVGFAFLPEYTGKGYAFEAASATVAHGFKSFNLDTIFAITMHTNLPAQRLLTKVGLKYDRDIWLINSRNDEKLMRFKISNQNNGRQKALHEIPPEYKHKVRSKDNRIDI